MMASVKLATILVAAALMFAAALRRSEWRGGLLFVACVFLAGAAQEFEFVLLPMFQGVREPETPVTAMFLVLGAALAALNRGSTAVGLRAIWKNRRLPLLVWGILLISILPNVAKAKFMWEAISSLEIGTHDVREVAEAASETLGCILLLNWSVLFLKDKWSVLAARVPSLHEHLLAEEELVEVGRGSRRVCYRIGDTGFCAKFYIPPEQCGSSDMKASILREIRRRRFSRLTNSSSQEVYVYERFRHAMPEMIRSRMPPVCERVRHPRWGWGILETYYANPDGNAIIPYRREIARQTSVSVKNAIYREARTMLLELIRVAAPFHEPGNFHVLLGADGSVALKLIDFEPDSKTLIQLESVIPALQRAKLRRKAARFLEELREKYGITETVSTEIG